MDFIVPSKVSQEDIRILPPKTPLPGHQLPWDLVPIWWNLQIWPRFEPQFPCVFQLPHSQLHLQQGSWETKGHCLIKSKAP